VHPAAGVPYPAFYHSTDGLRPETVLDWQYSQPATGSATFQGYRRYVLGPDPDERWAFIDFTTSPTVTTTYYPHTDRMGTTIALSTGGAAAAKFQYDAYGVSTNTLAEVGPGVASYAFRYTGQRLDGGTGLYDDKARFYSQALGRFLQPDSAGVDQGPNLYEYVGDDPINKADPTGMAFGLDDVAAIVIGGGIGVGVTAIEHGGHLTWGQAGGAFVSGAIVGEGAVNIPETGGLSAVAAGAALGATAGAAGNLTQQGVDNATGAQRGFSGRSLAADTAAGAVGGAVGGRMGSVRVRGLSAGRNSALAVGKAARTRIATGVAAAMSAKTAIKSAVGHQTADAAKTGVGAASETAKMAVCHNSSGGCN